MSKTAALLSKVWFHPKSKDSLEGGQVLFYIVNVDHTAYHDMHCLEQMLYRRNTPSTGSDNLCTDIQVAKVEIRLVPYLQEPGEAELLRCCKRFYGVQLAYNPRQSEVSHLQYLDRVLPFLWIIC